MTETKTKTWRKCAACGHIYKRPKEFTAIEADGAYIIRLCCPRCGENGFYPVDKPQKQVTP